MSHTCLSNRGWQQAVEAEEEFERAQPTPRPWFRSSLYRTVGTVTLRGSVLEHFAKGGEQAGQMVWLKRADPAKHA